MARVRVPKAKHAKRPDKNSAPAESKVSIVGRGTKITSLPTARLLARDRELEDLGHASAGGDGNKDGLGAHITYSNVVTVPFAEVNPGTIIDWLVDEGFSVFYDGNDGTLDIMWTVNQKTNSQVVKVSDIITGLFQYKAIHSWVKAALIGFYDEVIA